MKKILIIAAFTAMALFSVQSSAKALVVATPEVPIGVAGPYTWGAEGILLTADKKTAQIQFGCGSASITKGWKNIKKNGAFKATGTYTQSAGTIPVDFEGFKPQPAKFAVKVKGNTMTLVMTVKGGQPQTFTLTRGYNGPMYYCM